MKADRNDNEFIGQRDRPKAPRAPLFSILAEHDATDLFSVEGSADLRYCREFAQWTNREGNEFILHLGSPCVHNCEETMHDWMRQVDTLREFGCSERLRQIFHDASTCGATRLLI